MPGEQCLKIG